MVDPLIARLAARRRELSMSQRELGSAIGVGHGHLSQIETGVVDPKLSTLRRMADRLGVQI